LEKNPTQLFSTNLDDLNKNLGMNWKSLDFKNLNQEYPEFCLNSQWNVNSF
jgi:hypothetical protein